MIKCERMRSKKPGGQKQPSFKDSVTAHRSIEFLRQRCNGVKSYRICGFTISSKCICSGTSAACKGIPVRDPEVSEVNVDSNKINRVKTLAEKLRFRALIRAGLLVPKSRARAADDGNKVNILDLMEGWIVCR